MKTKVQAVAEISASNVNKRKRTASTHNTQETLVGQDVKNPKEVTKRAKKQIIEKASTEPNPKTNGSQVNDKIKNAVVKKQEKHSAATKKTKPLSSKFEENKTDPKSRIKQTKKDATPSQSVSKKSEKPSASSTGNVEPSASASKRASPDSKYSHTSHQPKVQKIQLDTKGKAQKRKVVPSLSVSASNGKGKSKQKEKVDSKSSIQPKKDKNQNTLTLPTAAAVDLSDPLAMLMMMEGRDENAPGKSSSSLASPVAKVQPSTSTPRASSSSAKKLKRRPVSKPRDEDSSGSEGLSDWEDVHDHLDSASAKKSQVPDGPVEITLDLPDILKHKKRKKKEFDWKLYLKRRVNRFKKEVAINKHKTHLLCLLSLGLRQNEELNDLTLSGLVMSVMPARLSSVITDIGSSALERRVEAVQAWYKKAFPLENVKLCSNINLVLASQMEKCISEGAVVDARIWVLVFICILRTLGLSVRLVLSLHAVSFKASQEAGNPGSSGKKQPKVNKMSPKPQSKSSKHVSSSSSSKTSSAKSVKDSRQAPKGKAVVNKKGAVVNRKRLSRASSEMAKKKLKESDEESDDEDDGVQDEKRTENKKEEKKAVKKKSKNPNKTTTDYEDEDFPGSESEFEVTSSYFTSPSHLRKDLKILSNRKVLSASSGDEEDFTINRSTIAGHDFWLELYFPEKRKWICFDTFKCQFGKPYSLENSATQPLSYVVAFKNDGGVKDVTARYAKLWMSHTRKQRVDQEWWEESLRSFNTTPHAANMEEDDEIKGKLLVRPIPTSIADLKNHPLYALRRHLLKFEAIYPDTAIPLGYIKQEPIYARECVRTLHSRDNWLKEGRMVRLAEEPYKMVKSRPKWNKPKDNPDELDLELYGEWQTDKYIPPPAVNGKVPKNEYGNLELFKPWMLPLGTVQLKVNGLQRIARKLHIDVAPAMVGWDHHSGRSHPMFDGVVVCEEYADTLMEAWTEDQDIQEQRETEKREKRVYGNWRLLIRGLLIKSRLAEKFAQVDLNVQDKKERLLKRVEELKKQEEMEEEKKFAKADPALDVQQSWPRRQQDEVQDRKVKHNKLKLEAARSLLEKGPEQNNDKETDLQASGPNSSTEGIDCITGIPDRLKIKGIKGAAFKRQNQTQNSFGNAGRKRQTEKARVKPVKGQKAKIPTQHRGRGKKSEEGESDSTDSEDDFSDEVDGESKTGKAKVASRPKRRSIATVKYFDSGDEDTEDFIDDSDNDRDFEQEKERRKKTKKKAVVGKSYLSDDVSDDSVKRKASVGNKFPETVKTTETRHWLDEEGSSSDENDFVPVEPEPEKDIAMGYSSEPKEVVIDLNSDKNIVSEKTKLEQNLPIEVGKGSRITNIEGNNTQVSAAGDGQTPSNPQISLDSKETSIEEIVVSGTKRQVKKRNAKTSEQADLSSKMKSVSKASSVGVEETGEINNKTTTSANKLLESKDSEKDKSSDIEKSKSVVKKSRGCKNNVRTQEINSKRKSLRITRQTS